MDKFVQLGKGGGKRDGWNNAVNLIGGVSCIRGVELLVGGECIDFPRMGCAVLTVHVHTFPEIQKGKWFGRSNA